MGNASWDRRYSFRLTDEEEDPEIGKMLDNIPNSKRSETIRQMLRYAYRKMKEERQERKDLQELRNEIQRLADLQEKKHMELLEELRKGVTVSSDAPKRVEEQEISDEAIKSSANAFMASFGFGGE